MENVSQTVTREDPILVCRAEMTPDVLTEAFTVLTKKMKILGILITACGGLFLISAVSEVIGKYFSYGRSSDPFYPFILAIFFILIGVLLIVNRKKTVRNSCAEYLQLNKSPFVDFEFCERSLTISNAISHQKIFYIDVFRRGESEKVFYVFFGSPSNPKTVFIPKTAFSCEDDKNRFLSLMQTALAGKEFKKY